jgi:ABC-2 type transport system permease protein
MKTILQHELTHWLRQLHIYLFAGLLFVVALATIWGMASEATGGADAELLNSSYRLNMMSGYFGMLVMFLLPATFGASIYRDYKSEMHTLLYAYPITKPAYLGAKFLAAYLVTTGVVLAIGAGFALGAMMPGGQPEVIQAFVLQDYLQLYGVYLLPNLLLFGSLVFAIVIRTRNIYVGFLSIILVIVCQGLMKGLLTGEELSYWAALLDPTGDTAVKYTVRFWTRANRNELALPLNGIILANRLLWLIVSIMMLIFTYRSFHFQAFASNRKGKAQERMPGTSVITSIADFRSRVTLRFSFSQRLRTVGQIGWADFRYIVLSWPFVAILAAGFMMVYFQQHEMNPMYGFEILPTTGRMLRVPMFIFSMIVNLLTFLYIGVLQFRGQTTRMGALIDIVPQPNWVLLGSRLLAVVLMQILLLSLVIVAGVLAQTLQGYYHFELGHYLFELLGLQLIHFVIWAGAAMLVYTLVKNMYVGFVLLLLLPTAISGLSDIGAYLDWPFLQASILQFNQVPGIGLGFDYSDLNGYGQVLPAYFAFKTYWLLLAIVFLLLSLLVWQRGEVFSGKERWTTAKKRFSGRLRTQILGVSTLFLLLGGYLYAATNFWAPTHYDRAKRTAIALCNEQQYLSYKNYPQPRLVRAKIAMDIYPDQRNFIASGQLFFVNKLEQPLDTILVATSFREQTEYELLLPSQLMSKDTLVHFDIWILNEPLHRGDTLKMSFTVRNYPHSLLSENSAVLRNGTYLDAGVLPKLGFQNILLQDKEERTANGLPPRDNEQYLPTDSTWLGHAFAQNNMDRIEYETIVSTTADQKAFSMGKLVRSWTVAGRSYAHYRSDGLITNNISWLSGTYSQRQAQIGNLTLNVYHHPTHHHNYEQMISGVQASIEYCSKWFGALEYDTLRLIEFPLTEGTHATLNGNLIPYSEALFMAKAKAEDPEAFNLPFYTSAHEVAHYWWGHRVDPANVQGGKLVTEALAEYLAMQVLEDRFGPANLFAFRKKMHNIYLRERTRSGDEQPLILAGLEQEYLNYRKGGLAFYALSEYWGEEYLNTVLAHFERARRYAPPPYPTSVELMDSLRAAIPDSLAYLIQDYFETITLYDNRITATDITKNGESDYTATVNYDITKYRTDATGKKTFLREDGQGRKHGELSSLPLQDYVRIAFYRNTREGEELLTVQTVKATTIHNELTIQLDDRPDRIVIDPQWLLFEENRDDNVWTTSPH